MIDMATSRKWCLNAWTSAWRWARAVRWSIGGTLVVLMATAGCTTNVGGKERPLIKAGRLQGEVELVAENRRDEDGTAGVENDYSARVFKEILCIRTDGDAYHPDFLSYRAMIGGGLTQFVFEQNDQKERRSGTLTEYDIGGEVLRKKRYPVTFHLDKSDNLIPRQFASSLRSKRRGAATSVAWRDPNWPMLLRYSESNTRQFDQSLADQDLFVIDDQRLTYALDHDFSDQSQASFDFQSNTVTQARGGIPLKRKEDIYTLNHGLTFGEQAVHRVDSFVDYLDQDGDAELQRLLWQERLRWHHSATLQSHYGLAYHQSRRPANDNRETRGEARLQHKLYQSLVTTGKAYFSTASFSQNADLKRGGGGVNLDYTKKNRWGVFVGRYGLDVQTLDQTGSQATVSVVDERHLFEVTGSLRIQLDRTNIDADSIVVLSSDRIRVYSDYTISQTNGITEILVTPGGDIVGDGDQTLSFDYDFLTEPQQKERAILHHVRIRERFRIDPAVDT